MSKFGIDSYIEKESGLIAKLSDVMALAQTATTKQFNSKYKVLPGSNPPRYDEVKQLLKANDAAARAARNNGGNNNGGNNNANNNGNGGNNNANNNGNGGNNNANNNGNGGNNNGGNNNANSQDDTRLREAEEKIQELQGQVKAAKKYAPPEPDKPNIVYRLMRCVLVKVVNGHYIGVTPDEAAHIAATGSGVVGTVFADPETNQKIGFVESTDLFTVDNTVAGVDVWDV